VILREGVAALGVAATAALLVSAAYGWLAGLPLWLLLAWLTRVYWAHQPAVPAEPRGVLAPVAGRVLAIVEQDDPWLQRKALRVSIRVAFPGILSLHSPTEGEVRDIYARHGVFGGVQRPCRDHESPDCYGQWLQTDEGDDVIYAVSSHFPVSRARFDHAPGERVGQGERCGFFYGASVADVLIPAGSDVAVRVGDRVQPGESVLALLEESR
jgi:phosphatidylserine decarboxylase